MSNLRRKITLAVIFCLAVCLIGIVVWLWPRRINKSLTLYTYEGDASIEATFDGTLHRHLRKEMDFRGKIVIDGEEYVNLDGIRNYFVIPAVSAYELAENDKVLISFFSGESFEDISIVFEGDENHDGWYRVHWREW